MSAHMSIFMSIHMSIHMSTRMHTCLYTCTLRQVLLVAVDGAEFHGVVDDNQDGTYRVRYELTQAGPHQVLVCTYVGTLHYRNAYTHVHAHACIHVHTCLHTCVCTSLYSCLHTHVHTHSCTHVYTHVYTQVFVKVGGVQLSSMRIDVRHRSDMPLCVWTRV